MKKCPNCSAECRNDAIFCHKCGALLDKDKAKDLEEKTEAKKEDSIEQKEIERKEAEQKRHQRKGSLSSSQKNLKIAMRIRKIFRVFQIEISHYVSFCL